MTIFPTGAWAPPPPGPTPNPRPNQPHKGPVRSDPAKDAATWTEAISAAGVDPGPTAGARGFRFRRISGGAGPTPTPSPPPLAPRHLPPSPPPLSTASSHHHRLLLLLRLPPLTTTASSSGRSSSSARAGACARRCSRLLAAGLCLRYVSSPRGCEGVWKPADLGRSPPESGTGGGVRRPAFFLAIFFPLLSG